MLTPTSETFENQTKAAKIYIDEMIEKMTLDSFILFFIIAHQFINRRTLERKEVLDMIDTAPKSMYYLLQSSKKEMDKLNLKEELND